VRVLANRNVCIGSGNCVFIAGGFFDQDEEGLVTLRTETPSAEQKGRALEAIARCPSGALEFVED
jgi:ferredoxin